MTTVPADEFEARAKRAFGDFEVDCLSRADLVAWCRTDVATHQCPPRIVMDVNGHALSLARTSSIYRNLVKQADVIHADGGFIVTLSQLFAGPAIPERSATTDMIHDFASAFEKTGESFYLFGATEDVNAQCADELRRQYPALKIAGRRNGFFSANDLESIAADINASGADVVWVGLGKPFEQEIALKLKQSLNAAWIITCGGCFNYVTGHYPRAPLWMQNNSLEWLHRLATNPRQLWWRYLVTNPHALWIALREH
jgi:exopolysaccharide biosynthesis WecB/TagA/CpsF family protein